jgi:hypothetical protein
MGFLGSLFSGICSAVSSICSAIGLGPIGTALTATITALNPVIGLIIAAIPLVIKIIELVAPKEVKAKEVESGELAVKAEACKDIKPDNYESYSEYINAVHESVEKDPAKKAQVEEKMKTRTEEEATADKLVSVAIAGKILAEKLNTDYVDPAFLGKANACGFDAEKTVNFIKGLQDQGLNTTDANNYFDGNLRGEDFKKAGEGVKAALGKADSSIETDEQKIESENKMFKDIDAAIKEES